MNRLEACTISFAYRNHLVLRGLNVTIEPGQFWAIAGPNGAGKTTLVHLLARLLKPLEGEILLDERPIGRYSTRELAQKIALVRQEFVPPFAYSVYETVMMARTGHFDAFGFESPEDIERVEHALEVTDTADLVSRSITELSGGERQRVFIARAIAQDTGILLLDEPTSHLDIRHQVGIYQLLKRMQTAGKTIVVISHDINLALRFCDHVLLLSADGQARGGTADEVVTEASLSEVFSVRMRRCSVDGRGLFYPEIGD